MSDIIIVHQTILLSRQGKNGGYDGNMEDMVMVIERIIREIG
jgi:hypothetical protein